VNARHLILSALATLLAGTACTKQVGDPPFPVVPSISLVSMNRAEVREFQDTLEVLLHYRDGDGDLGHPDPDIPTLIVKDARLAEADSLHLQPLAPVGANVAIEGDLRVMLPRLFLLGNGSKETTRFRIRLLDRAGNESNEVQTEPVTLLR